MTNNILIDKEINNDEHPGWYQLKVSYNASEEEIADGVKTLSPAWKLFVLGDGSPTKHLHLLTGSKTTVDLIEYSHIGIDTSNAPKEVALVPGPRRRRQVWLSNEDGLRLGYAVSWWEDEKVDDFLQNKSIPIGSNISNRKSELFRDIKAVFQGESKELEKAFGFKGPFWGRYYLFWHEGKPLTLIYEVFSPILCDYLGNMEYP